ncbi:MAG TPA: GTP-binding protein [Candidatus Limnocylindrales bacterium]|nr:GTP-binding protein [Candidatus Limnocylindrales bacterium]
MKRVAVDLFTGFLGSGKTTLLRRLIEQAPSRERIAVIVNEVGEVGIDGRVLGGFEHLESVVELAGGCICCSIDEYRFDFAIDELLRTIDPTLLLIETSGVADPAPAIERIERCGLGLDAVVAVVDAAAWASAWRISAVARRQIRAADFLVISKTDLVTPRQLASLRARLGRLQPRAAIVECMRGDLGEGASLLTAAGVRRAWAASAAKEAAGGGEARVTGAQAQAHARASQPHGHLDEERFESFSCRLDHALERAAFEAFLAALPPQVFRAKGFVRFADGGQAFLFNYVCGRSELAPIALASLEEAVQGVFIGRDIVDRKAQIIGALERCARPGQTLPAAR